VPLFAARQRLKRAGLSEAQLVARARQRFAARAARAPRNAVLPDLGGFYVLELGEKTQAEVQAALAVLRADPEVISAHEDRVVKVSLTPDDPSYSSLWAMPKIRASTAWDTATGAGVTVAIVDTGVDYNHPDLDANIWLNPGEVPGNGLDDDGNGLVDDVRGWDFMGPTSSNPTPDSDPMDVHGHGTHVAGTVAAEGNNLVGVIGVAFQAKVMAMRGLDNAGSGWESTLAPAIIYAADEGADVINASWGGKGGQSDVIEAAIAHASGLGAVFVAAAGNNTEDVSTFWPANAPRAVAVGATNELDEVAYFSNTGNKIDVTAPGMNVLSTYPGNQYVSFQGTSMAAPHVSGVAALIVQLHPTYSTEQVRQVLRTTSIDLPPLGFDPTFGHGRLDAANAVAATPVPLEVKFLSPHDGLEVTSSVTLTGVAQGPDFDHYVVEMAPGKSPTTFTQVASSTTPANGGTLYTFDPSTLSDGIYTFRLRAFTSGGASYLDRIQLNVRYARIDRPFSHPLPAFTDVVKSGTTINILGRAIGGSFLDYDLQWAPGRDATSGFTSTGITVTGGGMAPIESGVLGTWATSASQLGEFTVKLTVNNDGFSSVATATVYLEPDLLATGWPQLAPDSWLTPMLPARVADGSTRVINCANANGSGTTCRSFSSDGLAYNVLPLGWGGSLEGPTVGQLDNQPGDEVVIADDKRILILTPNLSLIREIVTPRSETFTFHRMFLSDLDGDGVMEIVAIARGVPPGMPGWITPFGNIQVYRADGSLYSTNYPRALTSANVPNGQDWIDAIAADLDGNGQKEILVTVGQFEPRVTEVIALNADGTDHAGWTTRVTSGAHPGGIRVADLDHDGQVEVILQEIVFDPYQKTLVRVLNRDGSTRPGWPVVSYGSLAIGDLDRDGREEIVFSSPNLTAYEPDGTTMPVTFPSLFAAFPVIADVDNDSYPDIVITHEPIESSAAGQWRDGRVYAISHTGAIIKQWRFFGIAWAQSQLGLLVPSVGDFNGDGQTDIAVKVRLIAGGGLGGFVYDDALTIVTNHTPFDPANAHWPFAEGGDAQQSRARPPGPGKTTLNPAADAHVRDGTSAGSNYGTLTTLDTKNTSAAGNKRRAFLRFSLSAGGGSVTSAKLRLHGNSVTTAKAVAVHAVTTTTWGETTITFNNAPTIGAKLGNSVTVGPAPAQYYEWDVTSYVQAQKAAGASAVSFEMKQDLVNGETPTTFSSREGASKPELVVTSLPPVVDQPPRVVEGPSATPQPVSGTTAALAVLGEDDKGQAALTYTWSTTGSPPAPVTFSATNGTNAGRNCTATFTAAGIYNLQVVVKDAANQTATAPLLVTVVQMPTTIVVTPATASVALGGSQQFSASVHDQFGAPLASQPGVSWTVSGGGMISSTGLFTAGTSAGGPFTVTASSSFISGTAQVTVTGGGGTVTVSPVADAHVRDGASAGANYGPAAALETKNSSTAGNIRRLFLRFRIDGFGSGVSQAKLRVHGNSVTSAKLIGVYAVSNVTWGENTITYNNAPTIGAKQGASKSVGLAAQYHEWDVTSYIAAQKLAGATMVSFEVKQDLTTGEGPSVFSSLQAASNRPQLVVTTNGGVNTPPTVATPASASPNPAPGTTTALSVLGADDGGQAALTYTWSAIEEPPAPVTFSANGTNAARNTTATFTRAGNYLLQALIKDAGNLTVATGVSVTVSQTLTKIVVMPFSERVVPNASKPFTATAWDQFGILMAGQTSFAWTVSGGGTINSDGLFTAGNDPGGPFTVTATAGGKSGTAQITVETGGVTNPINPEADAHVRDGTGAGANYGTAPTLEQKNSSAAGNVRRTFLRFSLNGTGTTLLKATLRLHGASVTSAKLVGVYAVPNVSWGETSITFNNAPTIGAKQGASKSVGLTAAYVDWDVTSYVQAQKAAGATAVSFELKQDVANNETPTSFRSRESGSNGPMLVVTFN
jgi:hypothetical protein